MPPTLDRNRNVLFLCTGNSARSILAEALMNRLGQGRFKAWSAGSHPRGEVHPAALAVLRDLGYPTGFARSKNWQDFATVHAPQMNFVFTVCNNAAGEVCPVWPGQPVSANWAIPDPAAVTGSGAEIRQAFDVAFRKLEVRISAFIELPFASLDDAALKRRLREIGEME